MPYAILRLEGCWVLPACIRVNVFLFREQEWALPSHLIYVNELISDYGAKTLVRIGTCGGMCEDVKVRDLVMAVSASTDSSIISRAVNGMSYAPTADFDLLLKASEGAKKLGLKINAGNVLSSDLFYHDIEITDPYAIWRKFGGPCR